MPELKPHPFQERAIDFNCRIKNPFEAIDMGLGKTMIALKTIERLGCSAIVFAPINPMYNTWPAEIKKWDIKATYAILHGPHKTRTFMETNADILLTNYHSLKWLSDMILSRKKPWKKRMLILDESSMVKSSSTARFKLFKRMDPLWLDYKMCLSATPSPNGYHDLWSQYFLLDRGKTLFKSYSQFRGTYFHYSGPPVFKTTIRKGSAKIIEDLIKPITFRLDAKDHLKMPELIHNEIPLQLTTKLRKEYETLEKDFLLEFKSHSFAAFSAGALSNKLRQFIQGALYIDDSPGSFYPVHTIKIEALKQIIEGLAGQPVLCPIQFKFERKMINEVFRQDVPCIAGGTSAKTARSYISKWNAGKLQLLLCHPASLSHGVNLQTGGHNIIWFGLPWSLEHFIQLTGRLYRQGQKNAVVVNYLVMKDTVDEIVLKALRRKDATQQQLLDALRRLT